MRTIVLAIVIAMLAWNSAGNADTAVSLTSRSAAVSAIATSSSVEASAYVLTDGNPVLGALTRAASRGARVLVVLPAAPYDPSGFVTSSNARAVSALRRSGARVVLSTRPMHLKVVLSGNVAYLDDTNFSSGPSLLVADRNADDVGAIEAALAGQPRDTRAFETTKGDALEAEASVLRAARSWAFLSSESFGYRNPVYDAAVADAERGVHVTVLVTRREAFSSRYERKDLERLMRAGAAVYVGDSDEKLAITDGATTWVGSANATHGLPDQLDWGLVLSDPGMRSAMLTHANDLLRASATLRP